MANEKFALQEFNIDDLISLDKETKSPELPTDMKATIDLLAALALDDNFLLPLELQTFSHAIAEIIGDKLHSSQYRTYVLGRLIDEDRSSLTDLNSKLIEAVTVDQVDKSRRHLIVDITLQLLESMPRPESEQVDLVNNLIDKFRLPISTFAARIDLLKKRTDKNRDESWNLSKKLLDNARSALSNLLPFWDKSPEPQVIETPVGTKAADFNNKGRSLAKQYEIFAETINSKRVKEEVENFLEELKPHPFTIALVGEIKHGKSSLFNLMVGSEWSPVGESVATTTAVIELHYAAQPSYRGEWLTENELEKVDRYIEENNKDPRVVDFAQKVNCVRNSKDFSPGGIIKDLYSLPRLKDYTTSTGSYSCAVSRVRVGQDLPALRKGAVIIDTPGVNDPMRIRDEITMNAAKRADCLIFVMRADKLGTESERRFMRDLLRAGWATTLLIVITHVDRLSSEDQIHTVIKNAREWLIGVSAGLSCNEILMRVNFFAFDARFDSQTRKIKELSGFDELWANLCEIAESPEKCTRYINLLQEREKQLEILAAEEKEAWLEQVEKALPDENQLNALYSMADKLEKLAETYQTDTRSRLVQDRDRLTADKNELIENLEMYKKLAIAELDKAIERHVVDLGQDYSVERKWEQFDQKYGKTIIHSVMKDFESRLKEKMNAWELTIQRFADDTTKRMEAKSSEIDITYEEFIDICKTRSMITTVMVPLDRAFKTAERVIGYGGAAASIGIGAMGYAGLISQGMLLSAISNPVTISIAAATGGMYVLGKLITRDPEERKRKFREDKIEKARVQLDKIFENFEGNLREDVANTWDTLLDIAEKRCVPLIREALFDAREIKLRCEIASRIRHDSRRYVESAMETLRLHGT